MTLLHTLRSALFASALVTLAACGGGDSAETAETQVAQIKSAPVNVQRIEVKTASTAGAADGADQVAQEAPNPLIAAASAANEPAPAKYAVRIETTKGEMIVDVTREWAPNGADRFYNLVKLGFYDDTAFFRVMDGFMAQIGIHGDPAVAKAWRSAKIDDDPVKGSNTAGMVTFATAGPNTRTTQIFFNLSDNANLDGMGFAPFGKLRSMDTLNSLHAGYGEGAPRGRGPHQGKLQAGGNGYLKAEFPELDYIKSATIIE